MPSREDTIVSKLETYYSIVDFVRKNYPKILSEWKLKTAGGEASRHNRHDADTPTVQTLPNQNGGDKIFS